MFRLVFGTLSILGIAHDPRPLKLHVVASCRLVQHESLDHDVEHQFLNLDVTQGNIRLVLSFPVHNS